MGASSRIALWRTEAERINATESGSSPVPDPLALVGGLLLLSAAITPSSLDHLLTRGFDPIPAPLSPTWPSGHCFWPSGRLLSPAWQTADERVADQRSQMTNDR